MHWHTWTAFADTDKQETNKLWTSDTTVYYPPTTSPTFPTACLLLHELWGPLTFMHCPHAQIISGCLCIYDVKLWWLQLLVQQDFVLWHMSVHWARFCDFPWGNSSPQPLPFSLVRALCCLRSAHHARLFFTSNTHLSLVGCSPVSGAAPHRQTIGSVPNELFYSFVKYLILHCVSHQQISRQM